MDFKSIYFYNEKEMLRFVDRNWARIYNVFYCHEMRHPGDSDGWCVHLLKENEANG